MDRKWIDNDNVTVSYWENVYHEHEAEPDHTMELNDETWIGFYCDDLDPNKQFGSLTIKNIEGWVEFTTGEPSVVFHDFISDTDEEFDSTEQFSKKYPKLWDLALGE